MYLCYSKYTNRICEFVIPALFLCMDGFILVRPCFSSIMKFFIDLASFYHICSKQKAHNFHMQYMVQKWNSIFFITVCKMQFLFQSSIIFSAIIIIECGNSFYVQIDVNLLQMRPFFKQMFIDIKIGQLFSNI